MISIKLFRLVFSLFMLNQNILTRCFGIEAKQPKQTILKQTKTNQKNGKILNFLKKYQNMLHIKLFRLVFCLFRFNRIQFRLFRIETSVEGHPTPVLLQSTAVAIIIAAFTAVATHTSKAAPSPLVAVILVAACRRRYPPPLVANRRSQCRRHHCRVHYFVLTTFR
jgi:hypothetical protein